MVNPGVDSYTQSRVKGFCPSQKKSRWGPLISSLISRNHNFTKTL